VGIVPVFLTIGLSTAVSTGKSTRERVPATPVTARIVALISILLWLGAILLSVEIPALTGPG